MEYANTSSALAYAPLLISSPGRLQFRCTIDLRPVNLFKINHQFPMQNLEQELIKTVSSRFYASVYFNHSYLQLPLDASSQSFQSFNTPDVFYSPTHVLQDTTNYFMHLQSTLASLIPEDLRSSKIRCLDDVLIHAKTVEDLMGHLQAIFRFFVQYNLNLHPGTCMLFTESIRWGGLFI